jgi:hypothetical protein
MSCAFHHFSFTFPKAVGAKGYVIELKGFVKSLSNGLYWPRPLKAPTFYSRTSSGHTGYEEVCIHLPNLHPMHSTLHLVLV